MGSSVFKAAIRFARSAGQKGSHAGADEVEVIVKGEQCGNRRAQINTRAARAKGEKGAEQSLSLVEALAV